MCCYKKVIEMENKNYKYKVTLHNPDGSTAEYKTETYELAESLKKLYTTMQNVFEISSDVLYATIEDI